MKKNKTRVRNSDFCPGCPLLPSGNGLNANDEFLDVQLSMFSSITESYKLNIFIFYARALFCVEKYK